MPAPGGATISNGVLAGIDTVSIWFPMLPWPTIRTSFLVIVIGILVSFQKNNVTITSQHLASEYEVAHVQNSFERFQLKPVAVERVCGIDLPATNAAWLPDPTKAPRLLRLAGSVRVHPARRHRGIPGA